MLNINQDRLICFSLCPSHNIYDVCLCYFFVHMLFVLCLCPTSVHTQPRAPAFEAEFAAPALCQCRKPCKIHYDHRRPQSPLAPRRCCTSQHRIYFPAEPFFFLFFSSLSTPKGQFQSRGYGSVEMLSIASCSFVSVVASLFDLAVSLSAVWTSSLTSQ